MQTLYDFPFLGEGWQVALWRLLAAFLAGALLGLERERRERPAGLRTHVLVCLTACLSMLTALAVGGDPSNPARVAAGVLTGIGFLGAGTIMRHGNVVHGLTTAAGIWAAAAVGMALGGGLYLLAAATLVIAVGALVLLRLVERPLHRDIGLVHLEAKLAPGVSFPSGLANLLAENAAQLHDLDVEPGQPTVLKLAVEATGHMSHAALLALVQSAPGVAEAHIIPPARPGRTVP